MRKLLFVFVLISTSNISFALSCSDLKQNHESLKHEFEVILQDTKLDIERKDLRAYSDIENIKEDLNENLVYLESLRTRFEYLKEPIEKSECEDVGDEIKKINEKIESLDYWILIVNMIINNLGVTSIQQKNKTNENLANILTRFDKLSELAVLQSVSNPEYDPINVDFQRTLENKNIMEDRDDNFVKDLSILTTT
ncbi:MAG: hypothetical protein H6622_09580 [Halobacteriovoraceae bacterium]|nr:hypothetical protein [Halobacteriovoraceae bacterium]